MVIERTVKFNRDFKKLLKKYPTLNDDFKNFSNFKLEQFHDSSNTAGIPRINRIGYDKPHFFKVKDFASKSIKGSGRKTGFRLIFYILDDTYIFIEMYHKKEKSNHDKKLITEICKDHKSKKTV